MQMLRWLDNTHSPSYPLEVLQSYHTAPLQKLENMEHKNLKYHPCWLGKKAAKLLCGVAVSVRAGLAFMAGLPWEQGQLSQPTTWQLTKDVIPNVWLHSLHLSEAKLNVMSCRQASMQRPRQ